MLIAANRPRSAYELHMLPARKAFRENPVMREMLSLAVNPELVELFVIHFNALSTGMVEPIAHYVRQAGKNSETLGFSDIGPYFEKHSNEENGHDHWAASDTYKAVANWNKRKKSPVLCAQTLLEARYAPSVMEYHKLHEEVINGSTPFAILAIATEIELITTKYGPKMLLQCFLKLGLRRTRQLSYVSNHVKVDWLHTEENMHTIDWLLAAHPEHANPMIETGKRALETYTGFLRECMAMTRKTYTSRS